MKSRFIIFLVSLFAALSLQAGMEASTAEKPSFSATQTVQMVAVVDAIDREARTVTLRGPEGNTRTLQAREDSTNIDQIEVGDKVDVEYMLSLSIEVYANDGMEPGEGMMAVDAVNEEGDTPAVVQAVSTVKTATVEEINIEANTFKLKWPGDEVKEYEAMNPENLKKAEVGDLVVVTQTEAVALRLQEVPSE